MCQQSDDETWYGTCESLINPNLTQGCKNLHKSENKSFETVGWCQSIKGYNCPSLEVTQVTQQDVRPLDEIDKGAWKGLCNSL